MADAEEERRKMGASIDKLETEKKDLEAANAKTIEENRYLLDQLEEINNTVSNADAQILSLNTTLESTRKELGRLSVLASQTSQLEAQLAKFEKEQADLQNQLASKDDQQQTAVQRLKGAERTVSTLQEQIDRIEREAIEERARHAEVVARFDRRRAVERELESAAGRLKGAAAATTLGKNGSSSVVSHFVKDILQDNANLQLGIVELREMINGSNEEVENLREQMIQHQPVQQRPAGADRGESLNDELAKTPVSEVKPDFHVHHHYHAAPKGQAKEKTPGIRRPKKRRNITSPGLRTPSSGAQTPLSTPVSPMMRATPASSAATILSQTSVTIPPPSLPSHSRRLSSQSLQPPISIAASSLPSSPSSAYKSHSIFDAMDDTLDSSRPTTPGSTTIGSPAIGPRGPKRGSDVSTRSLPMGSTSAHAGQNAPQSISGVLEAADEDDLTSTAFPQLEHSTIIEEPEEDASTRPSSKDSGLEDFVDDHFTPMQPMRPRLHRANSHDSILSTRDVIIPKLQTKRSQLLVGNGISPRASLGTTSASVGPVTSATAAVGKPSSRSRGYDSTDYNRLLLSNATTSTATEDQPIGEKSSTLGKRVGGWMFGKWGVQPQREAVKVASSTGPMKAKDALSAVGERVRDGKKVENRMSTHVEAVSVDKSLLQESLGERFQGRSFGV